MHDGKEKGVRTIYWPRKTVLTWGVPFVGVNANPFDPVFLPGSGLEKGCSRWDWMVVLSRAGRLEQI